MDPFHIDIPQAALDDLRRRLEATRWPVDQGGDDWSRGVPQGYLQELVDYWRTSYDWRAAEARINEFPQFTTEVSGTNVHFLHVRSPEPDATPMIVTHGWPGSFSEYLDIISPLTNPRAYGGDPATAYHLVIPTIPGFGFSGPPSQRGWNMPRVAAAWAELMAKLGYDKYVVQGGDFGAWISLMVAGMDHEHVIGAHVNFLPTLPSSDPADMDGLTAVELNRLDMLGKFMDEQAGYMRIQATRPHTLAYALNDSPVGQLAWVVEKLHEWSAAAKVPEEAIDRDRLLTNVMLYWLTGAGASSAHFYYDNAELLPISKTPPPQPPPLPVPLGVAMFPHDPGQAIRRFADRGYPNIVQWSEFDRGGHFPGLEQPELLIGDLQSFNRVLRG